MKKSIFQLLLVVIIISFFSAGLAVLPIFGLPYVPLTQMAQRDPYPPNAPDKLVQIIIFAGDNGSDSSTNLTSHYPKLIDGLIAQGSPNKLSIVLSDLDQDDDTHILWIHDGFVRPFTGLPDSMGNLIPTAVEYDMTNGEMLGGFLLWALDNFADENTNTVLSYYGHSTFIVPSGDFATMQAANGQMGSATGNAMLSFTDEHPQPSLLSPHALRRMLEIGTDDGRWTLDVLDVTHSFALSLEQVYELINDGGAPFADMIVGSPSYAYFAPQMAGEVLNQLSPTFDSALLAVNLKYAYESILARADFEDVDGDIDHPRALTVINSALLGSPAHASIKALFDALSTSIMVELRNSPIATIEKLRLAAANSQYYDTTSCNQHDWETNVSDGLLDIGTFLPELSQQFGAQSVVGMRAMEVYARLSNAVVLRTAINGSPWFAAPATPDWTLNDNPLALGVGLYGDFVGIEDGTNRQLSWQFAHYNQTTSSSQPYTLRFIEDQGIETWSDVINHYWIERENYEGWVISIAEICSPHLAQLAEYNDRLSAESIILPVAGTVHVGHPTYIQAKIYTEGSIVNLKVQFHVYQNGTLVFSDTVGAGYLAGGTSVISSSKAFTPTNNGAYTFEVTVDPDNRVYEPNELNNTVALIEHADDQTPFGLHVTRPDAEQWVHDETITVDVTSTTDIAVLVGQLYEYELDNRSMTYFPVATHELKAFATNTSEATFTLPESVDPGHLILHIWGFGFDGSMSESAEIVRFNYSPNDTMLAIRERTYFQFEAPTDDETIQFDVTSNNATMRIWTPHDRWTVTQLIGSGAIRFNPTQDGMYLVEIAGGYTSATYSLASLQDNEPNGTFNGFTMMANYARPNFQAPIPVVPDNPIVHIHIPIVMYKVDTRQHIFIPIITR